MAKSSQVGSRQQGYTLTFPWNQLVGYFSFYHTISMYPTGVVKFRKYDMWFTNLVAAGRSFLSANQL